MKKLALPLAFALTVVAAEGRAEPPPRGDDRNALSPYEQATARIGLEKTGTKLETEPDGKTIEGIDLVQLEVFEKRDPLPSRLNPIVNFFHVVTKPHYVARELLVKVGDRYRRAVVEESERNLRGLPQFSVVLILPTKGSAPDRIRLLVITKDLWSLRWPIEPLFTSTGALESLFTQIVEINLFGRLNQISANFGYDPITVSFGGSLIVPRVDDSRFRFTADVNPIINHKTGELEGSSGSFAYSKPLYSLASEWGYGATIGWNTGISRRLTAGQISVYDPAAGGCLYPKDAEGNPRPGVPCIYTRDRQSGRIFLTRSYGSAVKHNISVSLEASRAVYQATDLSAYDPEAASAYVTTQVPLSDTRIGPGLRYNTYSARYQRVLDSERLGLREEYQLGHNAYVKVAPSFAPLRDSRFVLGIYAGASYTWPLGDGMLRGFVESSTDIEPSRVPDGAISAGVHLVSPRMWFGRVIFDSAFLYRYANYLNARDALGGASRLRGYPSSSFRGEDTFVANLEIRTRSIEILSCQIAGVLFVDAGDSFDGFEKFELKRSAGFGLRAMLPQINRVVFRADWGFPLHAPLADEPKKAFPGELTVTFGQAFGVPSVFVAPSYEVTAASQ